MVTVEERACRFDRGRHLQNPIGPRPSADRPGAPEIDGIPAVTAVRTVIVTPSSSVVLAQLTWARPGQLLVGGDWIDVEGK